MPKVQPLDIKVLILIIHFLMFLGPPSFFSLLEGATCGLTFLVNSKSLEATRATFLEILCSSVDTPGSGMEIVFLK
jgi:hypothetical protein